MLFFHNSNSNRLIYSRVLQRQIKCHVLLVQMAVLAYSKIAQSSPPMMSKKHVCNPIRATKNTLAVLNSHAFDRASTIRNMSCYLGRPMISDLLVPGKKISNKSFKLIWVRQAFCHVT